jgi:ABC-type transport system substrate-binding protein
MLLVLAAACGETKTIEVPGETIVVEKEVIKTIEVPGQTVTTEVIKEVRVPGETVTVTKEVVKEVQVAGETVIVTQEVIKEVQVPGETVVVEVEKLVEVEKVVREIVVATPSPADTRFYMGATSPNPKRGGIMRIHQHGPASSYDIFSSTSNSRQNWMSLLYDQLLVKSARDPSSEVVPDLAYAWEISDDLSTYTFHIREGVKFHNGSDLTSADVKASIIRAVDPFSYSEGLISPIGGTLASGGVTADTLSTPDDYTLVSTIAAGNVKPMPWTMTGWSSQYLKIADDAELAKHNGRFHEVSPVTSSGSGPFIMTQITDDIVRTERNPNYWNPNAPYLDGVHFIWGKNFSTALTASIVTGQLDWSMFLTPADSNDPNGPLVKHKALDHGLHHMPDAAGVAMNNGSGPFADRNLRKAAALAIDMNLIRKVAAPYFQMQFHGGFWPYSPELGNYSQTKLELDEKKYFRSPTAADLAEAHEFMAAAGYASGADVPPLTIIVMQDPGYELVVQSYQAQLKENLGIESNIEVSSYGIYHGKFYDQEYDMGAEQYFPMHNPYPEEWLQYTLGWVDGKIGGMNRAHANMPGFDELLSELGSTKDIDARLEVSERLHDFLLFEMPHLPMSMGYINHEWWTSDLMGYRCDECTYSGAYMGAKWDYVWFNR